MIRREPTGGTEVPPVEDASMHAALPATTREEEVVLEGLRLDLLIVPVGDAAATEAVARGWVEADGTTEPPVVVPLYGAEVIWSPGRAAILAPEEKLPAARQALIEFTHCDATLRRLEREVTALLGVVEDDAACAVEFDERHLDRQAVLAERFCRTVAVRAALARVGPDVLRPPQHPPTLAGQLGERLRERARLADRLEFLRAKADVLDRVYDLCADRIGDFTVARRHLCLEWVIIVLLAAELIVLLVEVLAALGSASTS